MISPEKIENRIFLIRGKKVMLDSDLASLYGVETFRLNEAVKRNGKRFPGDFMFRLTQQDRVGGEITLPVLSHHRTYGSVYGGS